MPLLKSFINESTKVDSMTVSSLQIGRDKLILFLKCHSFGYCFILYYKLANNWLYNKEPEELFGMEEEEQSGLKQYESVHNYQINILIDLKEALWLCSLPDSAMMQFLCFYW